MRLLQKIATFLGGGSAYLLPAPTGFTISPNVNANVLNWTDPAGAPGGSNINIYYRDGSSGPPWAEFPDVALGTQTFTDDFLSAGPNGQHRYYKIVLYDSMETTQLSKPAYADVISFPSAPTLTTVANGNQDGSLFLSGIAVGPSTAVNCQINGVECTSNPFPPPYTPGLTIPGSDTTLLAQSGQNITVTITATNQSGSQESNPSAGVNSHATLPAPTVSGLADDGSSGYNVIGVNPNGGANPQTWNTSDDQSNTTSTSYLQPGQTIDVSNTGDGTFTNVLVWGVDSSSVAGAKTNAGDVTVNS